MLGFMAISGIFGLRNLQKLQLSLIFPEEIYCGVPAQLTLRLSSRQTLLPHYLLTVHLDGTKAAFPLLKPKTVREVKTFATFTSRGPGEITRTAVTSAFPVNFFVRSNFVRLDAPYTVFPKPLPLPLGWQASGSSDSGSQHQNRKGSSGETESIGTYTEAEPLKQIHWKLSARHDELLVKEMSAESGRPVVIDLEDLPGKLEERLGHAAFMINSLMAEGRAVGLRVGDSTIPPGVSHGHRLKMLGELACHAAA